MQITFRTLLLSGCLGWLCFGAPTLSAQSLEFGPPYTITSGFQNPYGIAVNSGQKHLLVADTRNRQVRWTTLISLSGTPTFQSFGFVSDITKPEALIDPEGLAADTMGHVYVADARKNQVNLYTWNAMSSTYEYDSNFASTTRNTVAGAGIQSPRDVAVGPDGKIYLLDSGRKRILRADSATDTSWEVFFTDSSLANPYGLDVGPDGRFYVADTDNHRIVRYNSMGSGSSSFGRYGAGPEQLRYPRDVEVDVDGRMYVIDSHNHRLQILDSNGRHLVAIGQAPTFGAVQKIALDADRHIYLVDSDRDAVIAFLGRDLPVPFDGWIRDYVGDSGHAPSDPSFTIASPDVLVRHSPDVDVAAARTSGLESIAFEHPRFDRDNYVYVAVRNRGTQELRDAVAKVYWSDPSGALTFPGDWHENGFFTGSVSAATGNALVVPPVAPNGVVILGPLRWRPPVPETAGLGNGTFVVGVRIVQPFDVPPVGSGLSAVRSSNNVGLRTVHVVRGPFPTGDQNTLVVRARYSDDPTPVDPTLVNTRIGQLANWTSEVSWTMAAIRPLVRGDITLPHSRSYYRDPTRNLLIELTQDALNILLATEPDLLAGTTPSAADDIGRVIIVTNDTSADIDWATTGPWPYHSAMGDYFLTVSVQGMNNSASAFEHGLGHQVSMLDLFAYPNVTFPRPFADRWDNMAQPFNGIHPTVWSKERATWPTELGANIVFIPRPARGSTYSTGTAPLPLYKQATAARGQNIAIALGLTPGVGTFSDETAFYYLEARSNKDGNADAALPGSGVLMYYVNTQIPQGQGPIIIRDHGLGTPTSLDDAAIADGETESPPGTGISTTVHAGSSGGPDFLIDINYTPPPTGYDVSITIGNPPWTSLDIWVDNQSDGYDRESGRTPTDRGDVAIGGEENRIYARVHNAGPAEAFDVEVAFFISEPYHTVGGQDDFTLLKSEIIPRFSTGDALVFVPWRPSSRDPHTCVRVFLRRLLDDTNSANNAAQQNLQVSWSTSHSPFTPVSFSFQITNPDPTPRLVYFRADEIPREWRKQLSPEKVYLGPREKFIGSLVVIPPPEADNCKHHDLYVTAWTPVGHTLVRLGGATVGVNLARQADLNLQVEVQPCGGEDFKDALEKNRKELDVERASRSRVREGAAPERDAPATDALANGKPEAGFCIVLRATGCTNPIQANTEIIVSYRDAAGNPVYHLVRTDEHGCYVDSYVATHGGLWDVTATIPAHDCLAPAQDEKKVDLGPQQLGIDPGRQEVSPIYLSLNGDLRLHEKGSAQCPSCETRTVDSQLTAKLSIAGGGSGRLDAQLRSKFSGLLTQNGVHSGKAIMVLDDGSRVEGEMHGITNANDSAAGFNLEGQFVGLVIEGRRQGCRVILQYALGLNRDPAFDDARATGLLDGAWVCSCDLKQGTVIPEADILPDGCQVPASARGLGELKSESLRRDECAKDRVVTTELQSASATLEPREPSTSVVFPYLQGEFVLRQFTQTFASDPERSFVALHTGSFELIGARGDRISGQLLGFTAIDPHREKLTALNRPQHLEGTMRGTVETGRFQGCEFRGVYGGNTKESAPGKDTKVDWSVQAAIICPCSQKPPDFNEFQTPGKATVAEPPSSKDLRHTVSGAGITQDDFSRSDQNKDGYLDIDEFRETSSSEVVASLLGSLDNDRNDVLDAEEMSSLPLTLRTRADSNGDHKLDKQELTKLAAESATERFNRLDRNHDKRLSFSELARATPAN